LEIEVPRFKSRLRSSSVVPGLAETRARMRSPSRSAKERRLLAGDFGSSDPPERCSALRERTQAGLVPSTSAISPLV